MTPQFLPERSELGVVRPNPARGGVSLDLAVGRTQGGLYDVSVYDVAGRRTAVVLHRALPPGFHAVAWDGRDGAGRRVAAGIYFVRGRGPGLEALRKVVLLE